MEENLYYIDLFDIYGELLTEKQKNYFSDYYFENLTLEEIGENDKVSKNAVSKQIKVVKELLENYENKLNIYHIRKSLQKEFENEKDILLRINKYDNIRSVKED